MTRDVVTVRPEWTIEQVVDQFWTHHVTSFPVVADGAVEGIATVHELARVPGPERGRTRVREIMRPVDDSLTIAPWDTAFRAFEKASHNGLGRLAVVDDAALVGYLSLKDLTHVLALRGAGAPGAAGARAPVARRAA
jgi:CBS domain-containing protein